SEPPVAIHLPSGETATAATLPLGWERRWTRLPVATSHRYTTSSQAPAEATVLLSGEKTREERNGQSSGSRILRRRRPSASSQMQRGRSQQAVASTLPSGEKHTAEVSSGWRKRTVPRRITAPEGSRSPLASVRALASAAGGGSSPRIGGGVRATQASSR